MDEKLSALIIDDEIKARELLKTLLEESNAFSIIRSSGSAAEAMLELKSFAPQMIFMDIRMPGKDGFALLRDLRAEKIDSEIVFVTAYDHYAIQAIHHHAFDYLLKPVNRKELKDCILQFQHKRNQQKLPDRLGKFLESWEDKSKLRFSTRSGYILIDPFEILYCEAEGNYSILQMGQRQHMCSLQLGKVASMLPVNGFVRLGRSLIVNKNYITSVDRKTRMVTFEKEGEIFSTKVPRIHLKELDK